MTHLTEAQMHDLTGRLTLLRAMEADISEHISNESTTRIRLQDARNRYHRRHAEAVAQYGAHNLPALVPDIHGPKPGGKLRTRDGEKPTNPKDAIGTNKLPLHLWPTTATALGCIAFAEGMLKYGRTNWRKTGVRASIYVDAAKRHLDAWFEGEEVAPDSGVPHLGNALACIAILVDARAAGKLHDDRAFNGAGYRAMVDELTAVLAQLREQHADKNPRHYTIADSTQEGAA